MKKTVIIIFLFTVLAVAVIVPISAAKEDDISPAIITTTDSILCTADHSPAEKEQTIDEPYSGGWCGNTQASFTLGGKKTGTFESSDAISLNSLYLNHSFPEEICECDGGIEIWTEMGEYTVNLEKYFVRSDKGQGRLTRSQVDLIKEIIERQSK